jgi:DnaK suppressor protein
MMTSTKPTLDKSFIQKQHHQLTKLREQLLAASRTREAEETGIHTESAGEAHEAEDDAQKLALLELDGNAIAYSAQRLAQIERALQKIADGTYGLSDASGWKRYRKRPIPSRNSRHASRPRPRPLPANTNRRVTVRRRFG